MASHCYILMFVLVSLYMLTSGQSPCCSPHQWTGHLLHNTGEYNAETDTASKSDVSTYIYYDYTGRRLATVSDVFNQTAGYRLSIRRIIDYNKGLEWRIVKDVCTRHKVTDVMPSPCFLDGASSFGYHRLYNLPVEVWYQEFSGGGNVRSTVSRDQCLFVTDTSLSSGPDYILSFGIYENITGGFVPSDAFKVPAICPQTGMVYRGLPSRTPSRPWYLPLVD